MYRQIHSIVKQTIVSKYLHINTLKKKNSKLLLIEVTFQFSKLKG